MADFSIVIALQIGFNAEALAAIDRLASAVGQIRSSLAFAASPMQPDAPRDRGANVDVSLLEPAEGPSRAAGETLAGRSPKPPRVSLPKWMTPERKERLRELWPTMTPVGDIRIELGKLPGSPVGPTRQIAARANGLKVYRPEAMRPVHLRERLAADGPAPGVSASAEVTSPDPRPAVTEAANPVTDMHPAALPSPAPEPPAGRLDTIRRIAASLPNRPTPAPSAPRGKPVVASQEAIRGWAVQRGLAMDTFDLDAVNKKAASIGHPGFILLAPPERRAR